MADRVRYRLDGRRRRGPAAPHVDSGQYTGLPICHDESGGLWGPLLIRMRGTAAAQAGHGLLTLRQPWLVFADRRKIVVVLRHDVDGRDESCLSGQSVDIRYADGDPLGHHLSGRGGSQVEADGGRLRALVQSNAVAAPDDVRGES